MARDSTSGKSRADRVKAVHQDALRQRLSNGKHLEYIIDIAKQLRDFSVNLDSLQVQRLRAAAEQHRALVDKYLPSLKAIEHSGDSNTNLSDLLIQLAQVQNNPTQSTIHAPDSPSQPAEAPKTLN